jgi:hypothetical protein
MKYCLVLVISLFSITSFCQNSYLDFIQSDNNIQWAAEYSQVFEITPKIRKYGIKQVLLKQMGKYGCIDSYYIESEEIVKKIFCKTDSLFGTSLFTSNANPYKSYLNNLNIDSEIPFIANEKKCDCSSNYQDHKLDIYKLLQVTYYKNSKLYIKNILVTPLCLQKIIDSAKGREFVWETCFSSCFNTSDNSLIPQQKKRCIDLGSYEQAYDFNYDIKKQNADAKVFTLKNPVFFRHLYEDILGKKITVADENNNMIPSGKVLEYRNPAIEIPVYDSNGNVITTKKIFPEINPDSFYEFSINQHFYFDTSRKILHSEINYIDVYRNVVTSTGIELGKTIYFRIYFINPALYKKPKVSRFLN